MKEFKKLLRENRREHVKLFVWLAMHPFMCKEDYFALKKPNDIYLFTCYGCTFMYALTCDANVPQKVICHYCPILETCRGKKYKNRASLYLYWRDVYMYSTKRTFRMKLEKSILALRIAFCKWDCKNLNLLERLDKIGEE